MTGEENSDEANPSPAPPQPPPEVADGRTPPHAAPRAKTGSADNPLHIRDPDLGRWTRWLVGATVATAVVGIFQWEALRSASKEAERQLRVMEAGQRPWIAVNGIAETGSLTFHPDFPVMLNFKLKAEVIGGGQAFNTVSRAVILPMKSDASVVLKEQKKLCDEMQQPVNPDKALVIERTVFPHQTPNLDTYAFDNDAFSSLRKQEITKLLPTIVGCVTYRDQSGNSHRTGYIYDLFRRDDSSPNGVQPIDSASNEIGAGDLVFRSNLIGDGPAN